MRRLGCLSRQLGGKRPGGLRKEEIFGGGLLGNFWAYGRQGRTAGGGKSPVSGLDWHRSVVEGKIMAGAQV